MFGSLIDAIIAKKDQIERENELKKRDSVLLSSTSTPVWAAQADQEKFALVDKVDARVAAWRDGKRDNLRALLGSLDAVLWEGSGWKKVGLHELVMANKVKIVYMKAIAKCHPDKVSKRVREWWWWGF